MTLRKQLVLLITALFVLLFIGTFSIDIHNTRAYLNDQLKTISQDTATSLGLTLSPYVAQSDTAAIEAHVNAIFDSGYYREITISDINGKVILERTDEDPPSQVPAWFIKMFPLETPYGESLIMDGWSQAGTIHISSNPEFAYIRLWSTCIHSLYWFIGSFIVIFGLALMAIHYLLRPLSAVEKQAEAISEKDYVIQTHLPWTLELRRVVMAMNLMSDKIRDIFTEQEEALERIRTASYTDSTTALGNRAFFNMRLNHMIDSDHEFEQGALLFLEVKNLQAINNRSGHKAGNALLHAVGKLIQSQIEKSNIGETLAARLSGATFAVALFGATEEAALSFSQELADSLPSLHEQGLTLTDDIAHIGLAYYAGQTFSELMSEADMALRSAQVKGKNAVYARKKQADDQFTLLTATQWISLLHDALKKRQNILLMQPTFSSKDTSKVIQNEVFLRISDNNGKLIPAGIFIPMANHYGLTQEFDRMVIEEIIEKQLQFNSRKEPISINLMPGSINNAEFVKWLVGKLRQYPDIAEQLTFELSEYAINQNLNAIQAWVEQLRPTGAKIGIEHFGRGNTPIHLIAQLHPAYLQIDGSFIHHIDENRENQQFVDSIVQTAHSHDIIVIAEFVETEKELEMVKTLNVDGVRGHFLSKPFIWLDGRDQKEIMVEVEIPVKAEEKTEQNS